MEDHRRTPIKDRSKANKVILSELSKLPTDDLSAYDKNEKINLLFGLKPSGWVIDEDRGESRIFK